MKRIIALIAAFICICMPAMAGELVLPAELDIIESEAFLGDSALERVVVPYGVTTIESRAFAESSVQSIALPESVKNIAADAFDGCENLVVECKSGGVVQAWCRENGVAYTADGEVVVLTMATSADYPPFEYYDDDTGELTGIDIDLAHILADRLGCRLEILDMDFDAVPLYIAAGRADFGMSALVANDELRQTVAFTDPYYTAAQAILAPADSEIASVQDLLREGAGHTVGVKDGTVAADMCTTDIADSGIGEVFYFSTVQDAITALVAGRLDCIVADRVSAQYYADANDGLKLLDENYAEDEYSIAVAKDSSLVAQMNACIAELESEGVIRAVVEEYILE